ncbi:MAG TPA: AAA family ATPase [Kofleriaceae bacterium]|nr:AAA family ATPase [Kofleriaceae bacterium]
MKIPYGTSDIGQIRAEGLFYVDKTPFLPKLESAESGYRHLLFLRPRRFGKSTLVSLLEHYYDISRESQFDALFQGLWIHAHPTAERNRYLVLTLDFSTVATHGGPETLERTFFQSVRSRVRAFLLRYRELVPPLGDLYDALRDYQDADALIGEVLAVVSTTPYKLYLLVDEYDHFANRLLSGDSPDLYDRSIVERTGFVRTFYATIKSGTGPGAVGRMFITGVTPLMLGDLASGFNIVTNVSQHPELSTLAGFTRPDVERAVEEFMAARPELARLPGVGDQSALIDVLEQHYDGYRFSPKASDRVFNSDMVLYFLSQLQGMREYPADMLDRNVRTDYSQLQRIGVFSGAGAAERRGLLEHLMIEGGIESDLSQELDANSLSSNTQFLSLLYYLGMLTLGARSPDSALARLEIPNRVIRELQWEHLALMLKEHEHVTIDTRELEAVLHAMGVQGEIQPFLELFHGQVIRKLGLKDTRRLDEKSLKLMLMTFLSLSRMFHLLSEKEFAQGYCDLFLGASSRVPGARFSWLLELKYLKADARAAEVEAAFAKAQEQVEQYASDPDLLLLLLGNRQLKAGAIVFIGTKKVQFRPWPPPPGPKAKAKSAAARQPRARPRAKT